MPGTVTDVIDVADSDVTASQGSDGAVEAADSRVRENTPENGSQAFSVRLDEFEGPFDLLLSLIAKHKLDVTVLALHTVIDDFLAHIRSRGSEWDLDEASGFLVVAATLLDLKAARLVPSGEVDDEEDLALLEVRDVLFARLLQYRAYKEVSVLLGQLLRVGSRSRPRTAGLDPEFAALLPEVVIAQDPEQFAQLAGNALAPKPVATVSISHIHAPRVSVREQAAVLVERLRRHSLATFRSLVADCDTTLLVVARFLALLELYREGSVTFDQVTPLGELHIRWTGPSEGDVHVLAEEYEGTPALTDESSDVESQVGNEDESDTDESDDDAVPHVVDLTTGERAVVPFDDTDSAVGSEPGHSVDVAEQDQEDS